MSAESIIIEEQVDERREDQIKRIQQLLKNDYVKKLEFIQYYLHYQKQLEVAVNNKEDLVNFLRTEEATDEILSEIFDLLDQSFSRGHPNYIYEFELEDGKSEDEFVAYIGDAFPTERSLTPRGQNFTYITRIGGVQHTPGKEASFKVRYARHKENIGMDGIEKGPEEVKSSFDVTFDFTSKCCYVQCGDKKVLSTIDKVINEQLSILKKFTCFSIMMKQQETVFEGEFALDKQTIILLDYIENEINDTENEINDYLGASFTNSTSDKVKSVRLRGSNLLESYEVADRVRNGDKMKSVRFQLRKKITEDRYLIPTINIDFDEPLKITFGNVDNASYIPVIIDHLRTALERSLSKTYRESEVITRIQGILHRARLKDSIVIHSIIAKVKDEVLTSDISDKELFIDILDRYLIGGE